MLNYDLQITGTFVPLQQNIKFNNQSSMIYKYSEKQIIDDVLVYIDSTYQQHYQSKNIQLIDLFDSEDMIVEYLKTSIMRYVLRYGKKDGFNTRDLYKAIHCIILLIHFTKKKTTDSPELLLEQI
jgi:hypothetical protein